MSFIESARAHRQRIVGIVGMAMVWPSIHNQILYPVTYAFHKEGAPSLSAHFLLYSIVMLAGVITIAVLKEPAIRRLFTSKRAACGSGIAGAVGIVLIVVFDFSSVGSSALVSAGIALAAAFVPFHFTFWSAQIAGASERDAAFDLAASYFLFCLITGLRIAMGLHGWPFGIAFPAIAAALSVVALSFPQKNFPLHVTRYRDYPQGRIVPAVLFVYIACIGIWLLDPETSLSDYPGPERAAMYAVVAALVAVLAALYRPNGQSRRAKALVASTLCIGFLVCGMLLSGLGAHVGYEFGNFPVVAGKIVLEMGIWLMMLTHAQAKHSGIVRPATVYLVFVVGASNVLNALLLFGTVGFNIDRSEAPVLAVSALSAIVVLAVVNLLMVATLSRKGKEDGDDAAPMPKAPCVEAIDALLDDEAVIARMQAAFKLSNREVDTLRLALKNESAKDMAAKLFVAESTVNSHLKSIYRKADVHSKKELITLAERYRAE